MRIYISHIFKTTWILFPQNNRSKVTSDKMSCSFSFISLHLEFKSHRGQLRVSPFRGFTKYHFFTGIDSSLSQEEINCSQTWRRRSFVMSRNVQDTSCHDSTLIASTNGWGSNMTGFHSLSDPTTAFVKLSKTQKPLLFPFNILQIPYFENYQKSS